MIPVWLTDYSYGKREEKQPWRKVANVCQEISGLEKATVLPPFCLKRAWVDKLKWGHFHGCVQGMAAMHTHLPYHNLHWGLRQLLLKKVKFRSVKLFPLTNGKLSREKTSVACSWWNFTVFTQKKIVFARNCLHNKFMDPLQTPQDVQETTNERKRGSFHLVQIQWEGVMFETSKKEIEG